ncbi:hypothetical protein N665_0019s0042 [Sinapis alba]|nr:hypothetical protein N665_0019s0042 [Sinapis alba]
MAVKDVGRKAKRSRHNNKNSAHLYHFSTFPVEEISHSVCKNRYHFLIRSGGDSKSLNIGLEKACSRCGYTHNLSKCINCKWCSLALHTEDWVYFQLEDNTHLLHGVIHSNGYAHLMSLNGREGDSSFLTGYSIINLLDKLFSSFVVRKASVMDLHVILDFYKSFSCSKIVIVRDLYSFLLQLICENQAKATTTTTLDVLYAWSRSDILKAARGGQGAYWVKRWALKKSTCKTSSPHLIDYCLKHFGVFSRCNPGSNNLSISNISSFSACDWLEHVNNVHRLSNQDINYASDEQIKCDLRYLYDSLLYPQTMAEYMSQATSGKMIDAATKILDCKHFIKYYLSRPVNPFAIYFWCHVELSDDSNECPSPPPELLFFPLNTNVSDLITEAAKAFQEVYAMFKRFEVEELLGYDSMYDSIVLKLLVGTNGRVEYWEIDCKCGTKDDDGERMLACDLCGVWHHTRCAKIENIDVVPFKFYSFRCIELQVALTGFVCRGESTVMGSGSNLSLTLSVG